MGIRSPTLLHITMVEYIIHPRSPQEAIPRSVRGENNQKSHQGCFLYPHQNHPYYYYPRIPPHPHLNIPPHPYPRMSPYLICLCPYCNYYPIYAPYGVAHHPYITSLIFLHCPPHIIIPYSMSPNILPNDVSPHSSRTMN